MAVTLIVEDGTGVANANVYDTFAATTSYMHDHGYDWAESPQEDEQLTAMIRGAAALDRLYGGKLEGKKVGGRGQSLLFPRENMTDASGEEIADNEVPKEWKTAFYELSWREYSEPGSLSPDYVQTQRTVSETLGPLSVTYSSSDRGSEDAQPVLTQIDGILASLIGLTSVSLFGTAVRI